MSLTVYWLLHVCLAANIWEVEVWRSGMKLGFAVRPQHNLPSSPTNSFSLVSPKVFTFLFFNFIYFIFFSCSLIFRNRHLVFTTLCIFTICSAPWSCSCAAVGVSVNRAQCGASSLAKSWILKLESNCTEVDRDSF